MEKQIENLYQPLFLYVKKRINSLEDAEDLTQEVFYKLAKSDMSQVNNLKYWVYSIAQNTITDFYRKKKILSNSIEDHQVFEEENNDEATQELSLCVEEFIKELPKDYQKIMTMAGIENKSQKEIAETLDMNYVTVRSKIQRGRRKLRDLFTNCCTVLQGGKGSIIEYERKTDCNPNQCE